VQATTSTAKKITRTELRSIFFAFAGLVGLSTLNVSENRSELPFPFVLLVDKW